MTLTEKVMKSQNLTKEDLQSYKNLDYMIVKCPICGEWTLDSNFICRNCEEEFFEDNYIIENLDLGKDFVFERFEIEA